MDFFEGRLSLRHSQVAMLMLNGAEHYAKYFGFRMVMRSGASTPVADLISTWKLMDSCRSL